MCVPCGQTMDFYSHVLGELKLPESVKVLGLVEAMGEEVRGICLRCAEKDRDKPETTGKKEAAS